MWTVQPEASVQQGLSGATQGTLAAAGHTLTPVVQPTPDEDEVVVVRGTTVVRMRREDDGRRESSVWAQVPVPPGSILNDGILDTAGRLWIGSVGSGAGSTAGSLLRVDPDGGCHVTASGFGLSNGMAWEEATGTLLHVDSRARTVWRHAVDASGAVLDSQRWLQLDESDGLPDGIALDAAGYLWVAVYGGGQVRRYAPDATLERVVQVPTEQVTSVALGGPDGCDLLITTARQGFDDARSRAEPSAGRLFHARADVPGTGPGRAQLVP